MEAEAVLAADVGVLLGDFFLIDENGLCRNVFMSDIVPLHQLHRADDRLHQVEKLALFELLSR